MPRRDTDVELPVSTLIPGYLVGLATSVTGNVHYTKEILEPEHRTRGGAEKASWKTERIITDPEEHKRANQARMKARQIISSVCAKSAFGLLCPEKNLPELKKAINEASAVVAKFNRTTNLSRVEVYVITGKIARDDVAAVKAINSEVRELLKDMSEGVKNLNVKTVREAASKARNIGTMLSPEAAEKIKGAIEAARGAARKITKAGERAAQEIDREAIKTINQSRAAFVDSGMEDEVEDVEAEARPVDLGEVEPEMVQEARPAPKKAAAKKAAAKPKAKPAVRKRATAEATA